MTRAVALGFAVFVGGASGAFGCTSGESADDGAAGAAMAGEGGTSGGNGRGGASAGTGRGGSGGGAAGTPGAGGNQAGASGQAGESSGGASCHGDEERWAEITAAPIACIRNSDCCVIVNFCLAEAQIVHARDYDTAYSAWPFCEEDDGCADCEPPNIILACVDSECVGEPNEDSEVGAGGGTDHCGVDDDIVVSPSDSTSFSCGG